MTRDSMSKHTNKHYIQQSYVCKWGGPGEVYPTRPPKNQGPTRSDESDPPIGVPKPDPLCFLLAENSKFFFGLRPQIVFCMLLYFMNFRRPSAANCYGRELYFCANVP